MKEELAKLARQPVEESKDEDTVAVVKSLTLKGLKETWLKSTS